MLFRSTVELATSSARALDLDLDTFLEQFGRYWVDLARQGAYQDLFEMLGSSLPTVLQNLDAMHARIALSFPRLTPPRFWCSDVSESGFVLHYSSTRPGLTSFVVGLVRGLADYLHTRVTIEVTKRKVAGHTHDELRLTYIS